MAETKKDALTAFDAFIEIWGVKYDKAVECLIKDCDALLAFYDFPAGGRGSKIEGVRVRYSTIELPPTRWKAKFGRMDVYEARKLKTLTKENAAGSHSRFTSK